MTIFISHHVNRSLMGWKIPVPAFSSLQCVFFIVCAPIVGKMVSLLQARGIHLSLLVKVITLISLKRRINLIHPS